MEIATGVRPPDLVDVETSTSEQLSANPSDEDRITLDLQRIAMRAHQEARQSPDSLDPRRIWQDGSRCLMVRIISGDRVFVWHKEG